MLFSLYLHPYKLEKPRAHAEKCSAESIILVAEGYGKAQKDLTKEVQKKKIKMVFIFS